MMTFDRKDHNIGATGKGDYNRSTTQVYCFCVVQATCIDSNQNDVRVVINVKHE